MPVPAPNLYPDFNTIRLSHVCFERKRSGGRPRRFTQKLLAFR